MSIGPTRALATPCFVGDGGEQRAGFFFFGKGGQDERLRVGEDCEADRSHSRCAQIPTPESQPDGQPDDACVGTQPCGRP